MKNDRYKSRRIARIERNIKRLEKETQKQYGLIDKLLGRARRLGTKTRVPPKTRTTQEKPTALYYRKIVKTNPFSDPRFSKKRFKAYFCFTFEQSKKSREYDLLGIIKEKLKVNWIDDYGYDDNTRIKGHPLSLPVWPRYVLGEDNP